MLLTEELSALGAHTTRVRASFADSPRCLLPPQSARTRVVCAPRIYAQASDNCKNKA